MTEQAPSAALTACPFCGGGARDEDNSSAVVTAPLAFTAEAPSALMTAADLGCREQKCQRGLGDPPMDCIWPDCGCGLYFIQNVVPLQSPSDAWRTIESAPTDKERSFLVLLPRNDVAPYVVLQVSRFEGHLYPDARNACIDWDDGITTATHWQPLPDPPSAGQPHRPPSPKGEHPSPTRAEMVEALRDLFDLDSGKADAHARLQKKYSAGANITPWHRVKEKVRQKVRAILTKADGEKT